MSKRTTEGSRDTPNKRQKVHGTSNGISEEITSARQLRQLLAFQQEGGPEQRKGVRLFKTFLEGIVYTEDKLATISKQAILKEYLESQSPKRSDDDETPFLPDLMQIWSFASQANNDTFQSAVSSVVALLLKTISTLIDFRNFGIQLCKTLLQSAQLKLISRGLSAPKQKEHIISPCLRLLTEIVSFDGGALARSAFAAKTFTFDPKILARNLSLWKAEPTDKEEARRKPSVRSNTIRYLLANFKFQASQAKAEILKYGNMTRALFDHVAHDPPELLKEMLETIKTSLLTDEAIPRLNKGYLLGEHNLCSIASIYRQEQSPNTIDPDVPSPDKLIHEFLLFVCSEPSAGILRPYCGWYPPGTDKRQADGEQDDDDPLEIDLGLSSVDWYDRFHTQVPVRNTILARFAQTLRPYADIRESELLIALLRNSPELVADYFFKKTGFAFDPKLTSTWIGYSAFLFSTVQLAVPEFLGRREGYHSVPPPVSLVIENILPQPLSQKVLTKCLNQQSELITFFAIRLLVVAFQKMQKVLRHFSTAARDQGALWEEGATRLTTEFMNRCPKMKDVINAFRKTTIEHSLQREATLQLLQLYYKVVPQIAFEEKFDASLALSEGVNGLQANENTYAVMDGDDSSTKTNEDAARLLELSHLLHISRWSPDMRWWHKPEGMKLSPFSTLLQVMVTTPQEKLPQSMRKLLGSIIDEYDVLQHETDQSAVDALLVSLKPCGQWQPSKALFEFLDDVLARLSRRPIKYLDDRDALIGSRDAPLAVSLLLLALQEQWPFVAKTDASANIAVWLDRLLTSLELIGEDKEVLQAIAASVRNACQSNAQRKLLESADEQQMSNALAAIKASRVANGGISATPSNKLTNGFHSTTISPDTYSLPSDSLLDATALHRLSDLPPAEAITSSHLPLTILALSSTDASTRRLALTTLASLMSRLVTLMPQPALGAAPNADTPIPATSTIHNSNAHTDIPQYHLLLGILLATTSPYISASTPVPYFCTTYAALVARYILPNPLHPLYDRVCRFHTRAPKFDVEHLPSWWAHQLLYVAPDMDAHALAVATNIGKGSRDASGVIGHGVEGSGTDFSYAVAFLEARNESQQSIHRSSSSSSTSPHATSLLFLLTYFYTSLRTPADLEILRKRGTLEPILAMCGTGGRGLPRGCYSLILSLLWRCTWIPDGSTMLITRKGIVAWLGAKIAELDSGKEALSKAATKSMAAKVTPHDNASETNKIEEDSQPDGVDTTSALVTTAEAEITSVMGLKMLLRRLWETCDRERVDAWSGGMLEGVVTGLISN